jgi:nicotinamide riboside transporter PnuC
MDWIAWASTIVCLGSQWLLAHRNAWGWPLDIIGCTGWVACAWLEGNAALGVLIAGCGVIDAYGWQRWRSDRCLPSSAG